MASDLGHLSWGYPTREDGKGPDFHTCSDPLKASLALLPQRVTAPLLTVLHGYVVPSLPCHMGGWIQQRPKPWVCCTGAEPIPVQAETSHHQPSSSCTAHRCCRDAWALVTLENVALPFFYRFENALQRVSQSTSYRDKDGARRK